MVAPAIHVPLVGGEVVIGRTPRLSRLEPHRRTALAENRLEPRSSAAGSGARVARVGR
jgi:hypothetical protein